MYKFTLGIFMISLISICGRSQDSVVVRDFETWNGITLRKSFFDKKLDLKWSNEIRLYNNSTTRDVFLSEMEVSYEIFKNFELGSGFRYINETEKTGSNQYRYQFDLSYRHKLKDLKLGYRLRYQNRNYFSGGAGDDDFGTSKFRLKIKADYNIKNWKFDPYISAEIFHASTTVNEIQYIDEVSVGTQQISGFEKMRYTIGTDFKVFRNAKLGVFYRLEKEFSSYPTIYANYTPLTKTTHIAGVNFTYNLEKKKND